MTTIACCAGSGSSVLSGTAADVWLTGEMSHHEVLDAVHAGSSVILLEHSNSERGYLEVMATDIREKVLPKDKKDQVEISLSKADRDPLVVL